MLSLYFILSASVHCPSWLVLTCLSLFTFYYFLTSFIFCCWHFLFFHLENLRILKKVLYTSLSPTTAFSLITMDGLITIHGPIRNHPLLLCAGSHSLTYMINFSLPNSVCPGLPRNILFLSPNTKENKTTKTNVGFIFCTRYHLISLFLFTASFSKEFLYFYVQFLCRFLKILKQKNAHLVSV